MAVFTVFVREKDIFEGVNEFGTRKLDVAFNVIGLPGFPATY
jgi:hypothetical protein